MSKQKKEVNYTMSYWIHEAGNKNNSLWRFFMCDYLADIQSLPTSTKEGLPQVNDTVCKNKCSPGSKCLCQEDGSVWLLGKDTDLWIKMSVSSSGGVTESGNSTSEIISTVEPENQNTGSYWLNEY